MEEADEIRVAGLSVVWRSLAGDASLAPLGVFLPRRPDDLLEETDAAGFSASDEKMPYFASLWPTTRSLVDRILQGPDLGGLRLLDLGCGVGAAGLAALRRGARVVGLDWEERACLLAAAAAERCGLSFEALHACDWRRPPEELGRFDRIVASDVLYEERNVAPVAAFLAAHLRPEGRAWIADPGRPHARRFPEALSALGLTHRRHELPGGHDLHEVDRR